jgi:hypothetical protein
MKCVLCGHNIDPYIARHNTGVDDCCDTCAIERRQEYMRMKGAVDESTVYGNDCPSGWCEM